MAIQGPRGGHPRGASSRHRDDRDGPRREPAEVVNNLSSPAPVTRSGLGAATVAVAAGVLLPLTQP